jgi:hypothetical protein
VRVWDAQSIDGAQDALVGADAVVHLAGESIAAGRWSKERKRRIIESRSGSGRAIALAIERSAQRPRVLLQGSAVGYYGPHGDDLVTETWPAGDDYLARVCVAWEGATSTVEALGVRRVVIRTGIVLDPDGGALRRILRPFRMGVGGAIGGGRQWMPWIHRVDEVAAIRYLLEHDEARGPFNLTAPHPVTNAEFSRTLGRVLGRPARMRVPAPALRLAYGQMATVVLDGQRAVPERLTDLGFAFHFPDVEGALRDLLGETQPARDGVDV